MMAKPFDIHSFEERLEAKNRFDGNLRHGAKEFHARTNRSGVGRPSSGYLTPEHAKIVTDRGTERHVRKEGLWEAVPQCPVCKSGEREPYLTRMAVDIYRCANCSHRYMDPQVTREAVRASGLAEDPAVDGESDEALYQYGLDLVAQLDPPGRENLMVLGRGFARFFKIAERNGWGRRIGGDGSDADEGRDQDAIFLLNLIEQGDRPHLMLTWVTEMLRPRGLLFVLTPNADSLAVRLLRDRSPLFHWRNVSLFTPQSLQRLATMHGLDPVHLETAGSEMDVIKSYMSGEDPRHGFRDPDGLFDAITPEFLHRNLLGSTVIGVFRRS